MTPENQELRNAINEIESVAVTSLNAQPTDDNECNIHLTKALARIGRLSQKWASLVEVEAYNIDWETDGAKADIPSSCKLIVDEYVIEDTKSGGTMLADALSDKFGWLVNSLNWRIV